jgi:hypothetical protein
MRSPAVSQVLKTGSAISTTDYLQLQIMRLRKVATTIDRIDRVDSQPQLIELKDAITELSAAVMQVARSGNVDRVSRVRDILNRVKREIYTILAQED